MDLTIAIPTRNRGATLVFPLLSLFAQKGDMAEHKVTIAIYDESDGYPATQTPEFRMAVDMLSMFGLTVQHIRCGSPRGFYHIVERIFAECTTPFLMVMDDDSYLTPGSLAHLLDAAATHLGAGAFSPVIQDIRNYRGHGDFGTAVDPLYAPWVIGMPETVPTPHFGTTCMLVRTALVKGTKFPEFGNMPSGDRAWSRWFAKEYGASVVRRALLLHIPHPSAVWDGYRASIAKWVDSFDGNMPGYSPTGAD